MTTDDAVARLRAGLDRDEAVARATSQSASHLSPDWHTEIEGDIVVVLDAQQARVAVDIGVAAEHIARQNPDRALRQVTCIRELLDRYGRAAAVADRGTSYDRAVNSGYIAALELAVSALASIYPQEAE